MNESKRLKSIDICVCTYQRRQLQECLASLDSMMPVAGCDVRIVVADNDVLPTAMNLVEKFSANSNLSITYLHSPSSNISIARNACLDHSSAEFLAFIDDDETASPNWLAELLQTMRKTDADVVLGPVQAIYSEEAPTWITEQDLHSTFPVISNGVIKTGYTCNVMMNMTSNLIAERRFNLDRGRTGGEDTEFFAAVFAEGGNIAYSPKAWVSEKVPEARAQFSWLVKRKIRVGKTHGILLAENVGLPGLLLTIPSVTAKIVFCLALVALNSFSRPKRNKNLLRGMLHIGSFLGILGFREQASYGASQLSTL
ncbi:MAG: glycosyltransferase [Hyphomicrobiales bacterium]